MYQNRRGFEEKKERIKVVKICKRIMKKLLVQHLIHDDNHHYKLSINPGGGGIIENLQ